MEVRFFKTDEKQLLIDSIDRLWRKDHIYCRNPAVLEHLVLNTPYRAAFAGEDNYSFVGMWDGDEVVGFSGPIPQKMNLLGKEYPSLTGTTWYVNKKAGKSVDGMELFRFSWERDPNNAMLLGIGASAIAYKLYKLMGAYMIDDFPRWIGVVKPDETQKVLLGNDLDKAYLPLVKPVGIKTNLTVLLDRFDDMAWNRYYEVFSKLYVGVKRDAEFLRWRYLESPVLKYHFIGVHNAGGEYKGLAVIRIEDIPNGYQIGRILEFIATDAEASVVLANAVIGYSANVLIWDFYCLSDLTAYGLEAVGLRKNPPYADELLMPTRFHPVDREMLRLNGFILVNDRVRRTTNKMSRIPWYITRGDGDQDRAN